VLHMFDAVWCCVERNKPRSGFVLGRGFFLQLNKTVGAFLLSNAT
jgi:hypothetical protein